MQLQPQLHVGQVILFGVAVGPRLASSLGFPSGFDGLDPRFLLWASSPPYFRHATSEEVVITAAQACRAHVKLELNDGLEAVAFTLAESVSFLLVDDSVASCPLRMGEANKFLNQARCPFIGGPAGVHLLVVRLLVHPEFSGDLAFQKIVPANCVLLRCQALQDRLVSV